MGGMSENWLQHQMTDAEAAQFERDGYLVIKEALAPAQIARLSGAVDRVSAELAADYDVPAGDWYNLLDFLSLDDAFFELIDHPRTFPKLWRILGWNLRVYHAHLIVGPTVAPATPQARHSVETFHPERTRSKTAMTTDDWWGWHRDSGQVNGDLEIGGAVPPRLSVKFAYYLRDALGDEDGNMWVVPGSHVDPAMLRSTDDRRVAPGPAVCVHAAAGDAVLFDRRIVHSSSPNRGAATRQVLFYGYSHRWVRERDDMTVDRYLDHCTPIQRQLLGYSHTAHGYTSPAPEDVPLRAWLEEHGVGVG